MTETRIPTGKHAISRVRHALRRRLLSVKTTERLTPHMLRVTLIGDDLAGFVSAGHDDHVKLCLPARGQVEPVWPAIGPDATLLADGVTASPMRDFTPRSYDAEKGELVIDFALHEAGPATEWAETAAPGRKLGVAGPRGSFVVADDFDWYLMIGDETALPAIGRRLEELRSDTKAIVIAAVAGRDEEQPLTSRAALALHWLHRPLLQAGDAGWLLQAVSELELPKGDGYIWVACETTAAKAIRRHLVEYRGIDKARVKAAGYWRKSSAGFHESHDESR